MLKFITSKITNKIVVPLFILMTCSSLIITYLTTSKVREDSVLSTKRNLDMLNTSIFQSLRNSMNTGDSAQIKQAEENARGIDGVKKLVIAKSKELISLYSPQDEFTQDEDILKAFENKKKYILESEDEDSHDLRMLKPMIATKDCISCHANQKEGDVIGVIDLTFSLDRTDSLISDLEWNILLLSALFTLITSILIYLIVKKATAPIQELMSGFKNLIHSNNTDVRLNVHSTDEVREVSDLFNSYMDKIREGQEIDEQVIEEANDILEKTGNGFFVYKVNSTASNPYVEDLKNKLNVMIEHTKETIDKINVTLRNYSESNFDYKIDDTGIYGDLGSLTSGIKLVGNNISEILAMIMNTGDCLSENTHALSNLSTDLSESSKKQLDALEKTVQAIDEITKTINENTQTSIEITNLANTLTNSAKNGHELANKTAEAMEDINSQVNAIDQAIEIINQIAFQTNILSLNAAVEAATAGEAGKGFAVVAGEVRNLANRSAQAAKEIKEIVDNTSKKANSGKEISSEMIDGYEKLNENINSTIIKIQQISESSKKQEEGVIQINESIKNLDSVSNENTSVANDIFTMSSDIAKMSDLLVTAASRASFINMSKQKVCDVDLVYDASQLKVNVLKLKDEVYAQLGEYKYWSLKKDESLDIWLENFVQNNPNTNRQLVSTLKELNSNLNIKLQSLIDSNSRKESNEILSEKSREVEIESLRIFGSLNALKKDKCKDKESMK